MNVPFLDLKTQYNALREELHAAMQQVIDDTAFAGGPYVERFEHEFAAYCQADFCAGVSSGTSALHLALAALDIGPGDEVITAANTFIATAEAIMHCGATPVLADCDPETFTLDPEAAAAAVTSRTRAIIPVHLYGQPAEMNAFVRLGEKYNLAIIEDACQAHGAEYKGRRTGSIGHAGCFSFYPGKNLGAYGDAGAVVSSDPDLIQRVRMLRDHGSRSKYDHSVIGWNARMDGLQGAVLSVKLRHLDDANRARRAHAHLYRELLQDCGEIALPAETDGLRHVFHIFAIRCGQRNELMDALKEQGVGCGIHYPVPVHLQQACAFLGKGPGTYPVAEACALSCLSLPMFPELTAEQINRVACVIDETTRKTKQSGRAFQPVSAER